MSFKTSPWSGSIVVSLLLASVVYAQIRSSTVTGTLKDATGAVVAGAQGALTNEDTNITTNTKTTDAGEFTFPYLQGGLYVLSVNVVGFVPYRETGMRVETNQTIRIDVNLKVGAVASAMEGKAELQQLQKDS